MTIELTTASDANREGIREELREGAVSSTGANLANVEHVVNTFGKYAGKMIWNSTTSKPVWAVGSSANSEWVPAVTLPDIVTDLADIREFGSITGSISGLVTQAIAAGKAPYVPPGRHYWGETVTLARPTRILFGGGGPSWGSVFTWRQTNIYRNDRCVLWTDENVDFFLIESVSVHLDGGCFEVKDATGYNKAIFRYRPHFNTTGETPFRETQGSYDGSITNFWVVGNRDTLHLEESGGARAIFIDWEDAPTLAYMYFHKWQGRADYVHSGFSENRLNQGVKTGQNTTWNECDLKVWGAKQPLIVNAQNRSRFRLDFQPQGGLHANEQDLACIEVNSSGNTFDVTFVDLGLPYSETYGYSNKKTVKATQGNHFVKRAPQETSLLLASPVETGMAINSQPTGVVNQTRQPNPKTGPFNSEMHNQLIAFEKRGTFTYGYYDGDGVDLTATTEDSATESIPVSENISLASPATLFRNHGFRSSIDFTSSSPDDYLELVFDWASNQGRFWRLAISLTGVANGGIRKYQVIQISSTDTVVTNKTFELSRTGDALSSFHDLECLLDVGVFTKRLIIRFIGSHAATASYPIQDIAIYDDRRLLPTYLPIYGGTVHGTVAVDALQVKDAGGTLRTIQPKTAGTPADLAALVALLKTTGILT